ncbi:MAG: exonuclease domain-containing protein [Candidatus Magasanikbacteria bacterium]|nr:exonuclease domain-containing protein [Candidatus Magasanikbacteria bacterium]
MNIIFLDTETTDLDPGRRLVQLAYKNLGNGKIVNEFFKPPMPISFGAMAIHHVTNEMVADKPIFSGSALQSELAAELAENILVAHNAPFDLEVLKNEGVAFGSNIDTLRVARHVITAEQYALQFLRYFLNLPVDAGAAAHDALGDVLVLEALFDALKKIVAAKFLLSDDAAIIEKMLELTKTPALLTSMNFGKYRGKTFEEVAATDLGYLNWLLGSETQKPSAEQNEELVFTLKKYCK